MPRQRPSAVHDEVLVEVEADHAQAGQEQPRVLAKVVQPTVGPTGVRGRRILALEA